MQNVKKTINKPISKKSSKDSSNSGNRKVNIFAAKYNKKLVGEQETSIAFVCGK